MKAFIYKTLIILLILFKSNLSFSQSFVLRPSSISPSPTVSNTFWCNNINSVNNVTYKWTIGNGWKDIYNTSLNNVIITNSNMLTAIPPNCPPRSISVTPIINGRELNTLSSAIHGNCTSCELKPPGLWSTIITHNSVKVRWNFVQFSFGYQLEYKNCNSNSWITINNSSTTFGREIKNLLEDTCYEFRIRTKCSNTPSYGDWSPVLKLSTPKECRENITLTQTLNTGDVIYEEVSNTITSYSTIQNNALAFYSAGNSIILKPGFHAKRVSTFAAFIGGCSETASKQFYEDNYENETSSIAYRKEKTQETSDLELIKLYPNPTTGMINIKSTKTINAWEIKNNLGVTLKRSNSSNMKQFNIQSLPNGIYFIQLMTNTGETFTKRIIKE